MAEAPKSAGMIHTLSLRVPRHAVSPRQVVRAGGIWRLLQSAAVSASEAAGWPGPRYRAEGVAFIIARMTTTHHRELRYGEDVQARTWVRDFRRGVLSRRQIRLSVEGVPLASTTQQWVHVDSSMKPVRSSEALQKSFRPAGVQEPLVELPLLPVAEDGPARRMSLTCWHSWMDPLGHANHPAYLDWCDEATMRWLAAAGHDPQQLVAIAEDVQFKQGVTSGDAVRIESQLRGGGQGKAVIRHHITRPDGQRFATATTVRALADGTDLVATLHRACPAR